jgi:hypothetical protein
MAKLLALFRRNVATVVEDGRADTEALVGRLKRMTPRDLLRQGPEVWSRLTLSQYYDIVATIAPDLNFRSPKKPAAETAAASDRFLAWWRRRSTLARSFYLTTITTAIVVTVTITSWPTIVWRTAPYTLVRSEEITYWPFCGRLEWNTDGCVYIARQALNWDWIAYHLALPVEELQRTNVHLPTTQVPAGSQVIVWRGRGQLQRKQQ